MKKRGLEVVFTLRPVSLAALALTVTTSGLAQELPTEILEPQAVVRQFERCGFVGITVRYDGGLQSDTITVAEDQSASQQQIECAAQATTGSPQFLYFLPEDLVGRFHDAQSLLLRPAIEARAAERLALREDLGQPPSYDPQQQTVEDFALEIESYCGDQATGIFQSEFGANTVNPAWFEGQIPDGPKMAAFECALNVALLTGFDISFIGNEKVAQGASEQ